MLYQSFQIDIEKFSLVTYYYSLTVDDINIKQLI